MTTQWFPDADELAFQPLTQAFVGISTRCKIEVRSVSEAGFHGGTTARHDPIAP